MRKMIDLILVCLLGSMAFVGCGQKAETIPVSKTTVQPEAEAYRH